MHDFYLSVCSEHLVHYKNSADSSVKLHSRDICQAICEHVQLFVAIYKESQEINKRFSHLRTIDRFKSKRYDITIRSVPHMPET